MYLFLTDKIPRRHYWPKKRKTSTVKGRIVLICGGLKDPFVVITLKGMACFEIKRPTTN